MYYDLIPDELKALRQWGLYRLIWQPKKNKYTKIPHSALDGGDGKSNDPSTWTDFQTALKALTTYNMDGLGFYFANGYMGIDVDHVAGDLERWRSGDDDDNIVSEFMAATESYTETSVSKAGIHIIIKGKIPGDRRRKGDVEMYTEGRFFAMTGSRIGHITRINQPKPAKIKQLYDHYLATKSVIKLPGKVATKNDLSESEIIDHALKSKTGKRFKLFLSGGWEEFYTSQSEADLAFANDLAFWSGRDFTKMDSIFRQSSLMRDKWDERHGKTTYGVATLNKAINEATETFQTKHQPAKYDLAFLKNSEDKSDKPKPARSWDDTGNADRFLDLYGDIARYSYTNKVWYVYNGATWEEDTTGQIYVMIDGMIETMKNEKISLPEGIDEKEEAKLVKAWHAHIKRTRNNAGKKALMDELKHRLPVRDDEFDQAKMLLNTNNGYIDLTDGVLHDHDIKQMFSKQAAVEYTDNIDAPRWEQFLDEIFAGDKDLIHYIQKAVGYSLTGSIKEQVMFILHGDGNNGKSLFIEVLSDIIGSYARTMQASTIMVKSFSGGANTDIARLKGARLVISSEPNEGVRLDEGLVKQLTGGDKVTARQLYGKEFEFTPEFKLWLATNHEPIIRGTDNGIWRRLMLIPFKVIIPPEKIDKDLKYKLQRENAGILNWAVEGALMWQREGLNPPNEVLKASHKYRSEMDVIQRFIDDCCEVGPGKSESAKDLYNKYKFWANDQNDHLFTGTMFGKKMTEKFKKRKTKLGAMYDGIELNDHRLDFLKNTK